MGFHPYLKIHESIFKKVGTIPMESIKTIKGKPCLMCNWALTYSFPDPMVHLSFGNSTTFRTLKAKQIFRNQIKLFTGKKYFRIPERFKTSV